MVLIEYQLNLNLSIPVNGPDRKVVKLKPVNTDGPDRIPIEFKPVNPDGPDRI